jgi:hypothetical protein
MLSLVNCGLSHELGWSTDMSTYLLGIYTMRNMSTHSLVSRI